MGPPRAEPPHSLPSCPPLTEVTRGPSEKATCDGLRSRGPVGIPQGLWPCQSRQLLRGVGAWGAGGGAAVGAYIGIYGREEARRGPGASSRRKGKGALGVATKAPSAGPESTPSQWAWLTSICAWEFPAQGQSQAQTLEPDQGHSGKCSPLGVRRACRDFWGRFVKEPPRGLP